MNASETPLLAARYKTMELRKEVKELHPGFTTPIVNTIVPLNPDHIKHEKASSREYCHAHFRKRAHALPGNTVFFSTESAPSLPVITSGYFRKD